MAKDTMKAVVFQCPGKVTVEERPIPKIQDPTDIIVKVDKVHSQEMILLYELTHKTDGALRKVRSSSVSLRVIPNNSLVVSFMSSVAINHPVPALSWAMSLRAMCTNSDPQ